MQFNQVNKNTGDVNNAISEQGNVVQTAGAQNTVKVSFDKANFWSLLCEKLASCWKWIAACWTWIVG